MLLINTALILAVVVTWIPANQGQLITLNALFYEKEE